MIESCWKYLKYRGVYISSNHLHELSKIESIKGAKYEGYFCHKHNKYIFSETDDLSSIKEPPQVYKENQMSGIKYLNNELYYAIRNHHFR